MNRNMQSSGFPPIGSPRAMMIAAEGRGSPPMQGFEWRLATQEQALQNLMNNVTTLKAEIVDGARANKDFWKKYRGDHEHIMGEFKSFGDLIHRMNNDFINYKSSIESRLAKQTESDSALKQLESHHVSSLTDIRSRISRCDQAIAKLVAEVQSISDKVQKTTEHNQESSSQVYSRLKVVESRLLEMSSSYELNDFQQRSDRQSSEIAPALRNSHDLLVKQLSDLDNRLSRSIDQSRAELHSSAQASLNERHALENRLADRINSLISSLENRVHSLEQNPKEDILGHAIREHVDSLDRDHALFKQQVTKTFRELESRMNKMADDLTNRQFDDLQELRNEIREGFKTLHDSIQNSKTVLDGKHKLLEENLRQELSQIRKMVVLM